MPSVPARRPSAGARPGRCGFSLAAKRTGRFQLLLGRFLFPLVFLPQLRQCLLDIGPQLPPARLFIGGQLGQGRLTTHTGEVTVLLPMFQRLLTIKPELGRVVARLLGPQSQVRAEPNESLPP